MRMLESVSWSGLVLTAVILCSACSRDEEPGLGPIIDAHGSVVGVVRDSATGKGIEGATVHLEGRLSGVAVSRMDGTFRFDTIPPGSFQLRVTPPEDYAPTEEAAALRAIEMRPGLSFSIPITLVKLGTLQVDVKVESHNEPGIRLAIIGGGTVRVAFTNAGGRVTLQGVRPGPYSVEAHLEPGSGLAQVGGGTVTVTGGETAVATVAVRSTVTAGAQPNPRVAGSESRTCALDERGRAYCWGANAAALGIEATPVPCPDFEIDPSDCMPVPAPVRGDMSFRTIVMGGGHQCALTELGAAYCWGYAPGTISAQHTPARVPGNHTFTTLAAGSFGTCGLTPTGEAYCWGQQLGGQTISDSPRPVLGAIRFASLTAGRLHVCGLTETGRAYCWGANNSGQLGTATNCGTDGCIEPVPILGLRFKSIVAGKNTTCAIAADDRAFCWGLVGAAARVAPVRISETLRFSSLWGGASSDAICGLTASGEAWCWTTVALPGSPYLTPEPARIAPGIDISSIAVGWSHVCATSSTSKLYCWGRNGTGQLGDGTFDSRIEPRIVNFP